MKVIIKNELPLKSMKKRALHRALEKIPGPGTAHLSLYRPPGLEWVKIQFPFASYAFLTPLMWSEIKSIAPDEDGRIWIVLGDEFLEDEASFQLWRPINMADMVCFAKNGKADLIPRIHRPYVDSWMSEMPGFGERRRISVKMPVAS